MVSFNCPSYNTEDHYACRINTYDVQFRQMDNDDDFITRVSNTDLFKLGHLIPFTSYEIKVNVTYNQSYCSSYSDVVVGKTDPVGEKRIKCAITFYVLY